MNVLARFWVKEITHHHTAAPGEQCATVKLAAAYNNGKGNENWSKYTPQGEISMMITNPDAIAAFELGKTFQIEFSPVD